MIVASCVVIHSRMLQDKYHDFSTIYINALYFTVYSSTTVGYGDALPVTSIFHYLFLIMLLLSSITFFGYFLSKSRSIIKLSFASYSGLVQIAEEEMYNWISIRENDSSKKDPQLFTQSSGFKERKFLNTYISYLHYHIAGIVQESAFFHQLRYKDQQIILESPLYTFLNTFSYLTKTLGQDTMKVLYSAFATRVYEKFIQFHER